MLLKSCLKDLNIDPEDINHTSKNFASVVGCKKGLDTRDVNNNRSCLPQCRIMFYSANKADDSSDISEQWQQNVQKCTTACQHGLSIRQLYGFV